jgi:hypothetical protein
MSNIDEQKQREIAIILQSEQYKNEPITEELIAKISAELEESVGKVSSVIETGKENKPYASFDQREKEPITY